MATVLGGLTIFRTRLVLALLLVLTMLLRLSVAMALVAMRRSLSILRLTVTLLALQIRPVSNVYMHPMRMPEVRVWLWRNTPALYEDTHVWGIVALLGLRSMALLGVMALALLVIVASTTVLVLRGSTVIRHDERDVV